MKTITRQTITDFDIQALVDNELGWEEEKSVRACMLNPIQMPAVVMKNLPVRSACFWNGGPAAASRTELILRCLARQGVGFAFKQYRRNGRGARDRYDLVHRCRVVDPRIENAVLVANDRDVIEMLA
jgi:hypothetical protein